VITEWVQVVFVAIAILWLATNAWLLGSYTGNWLGKIAAEKVARLIAKRKANKANRWK
jgi:membrane protein YqaA with SNARE-associated domain